MTRLTRSLKFDWTNPNTYQDEPPSNPYSPGNPNAAESDPNIPPMYDEVPTSEELMRPDKPPAPEWGPKEPIPYILHSWPPKTPIEAPPPDRPPMWFYGPTPSQIAGADAAGKAASDGLARMASPPVQNLTTRMLRMKGVPEPDIAAAIDDPGKMHNLLIQLYGKRSAISPGNGSVSFGNKPGQVASADQQGRPSTPPGAEPNNYLPFGWAGLAPPLR